MVRHKVLQLFVGALVVAYERDAVGLVVRVTSVRDSLIIEQGQVGVGVVVFGGYVPKTGRPDVHRAEAPVLPAGVAEISARVKYRTPHKYACTRQCRTGC